MELEELLNDKDIVKFEEMYNEATIGISDDDKPIYDYDKMVEILVREEGMEEIDACDYLDHQNSFICEERPIIMFKVFK